MKMRVPLLGSISLTGAIIGAVLLVFVVNGIRRGFKKESRGLLMALAAMAVCAYPDLHAVFTRGIARVFPGYAPYIAYIISYCGVLALLFFIGKKIPPVLNSSPPGVADRCLGGASGLVKGFFAASMLLLVKSGWHLPGSEINKISELAGYVGYVWSKLGLIPELHDFAIVLLLYR